MDRSRKTEVLVLAPVPGYGVQNRSQTRRPIPFLFKKDRRRRARRDHGIYPPREPLPFLVLGRRGKQRRRNRQDQFLRRADQAGALRRHPGQLYHVSERVDGYTVQAEGDVCVRSFIFSYAFEMITSALNKPVLSFYILLYSTFNKNYFFISNDIFLI